MCHTLLGTEDTAVNVTDKSTCNKQTRDHQKEVKENYFREHMFEANKTGVWGGWGLDGMIAL